MSDGGSQGKKPMLVKLLMLGGVGILILGLLVGGGLFGYRFLKAKQAAKSPVVAAEPQSTEVVAADEQEEEEEAPAASGEGEGASTGPAILVYKNNVNLEGRKNTYLVVELHVIFRDAELGKLATSEKPTAENSIIRAMILETLSGKKLEEVSDMETRETMRLEIKDKLNEKFAPKPPKPGEKEDKKHKKPKHPIKDVLVVSWAIAQ